MNKIFNINLGGYPFAIDEDAYELLSNYLKTIHNHFRQSEGYEEITADIESRLAELFQEQLEGRPIVTRRDVEEAIAVMGRPEDFGAEPLEGEEAPGEKAEGAARQKSAEKTRLKTGKRLFRHPDDQVLGGVCAGIAAYFGIEDPLWVRLAFLLITFTGGFGVPLYIILWIIVPEAKTASDRLAMRGEPINVSNIGKIIEEEVEHFSRKMSELGDELKDELGSKKKSFAQGAAGAYSTGGDALGQIGEALRVCFRFCGELVRSVIAFVLQIWKPLFFIVGLALIIAFAAIWIASVAGIFYGFPFLNHLWPESQAYQILFPLNVLFLIGIPLVSLILLVMRLFFRSSITPRFRTGLWLFWGLNVVGFFFLLSSTARQFQVGQEVLLDEQVLPAADTLVLAVSEYAQDDPFIHFDELRFSGEALISSEVKIDIVKGEGEEFRLRQVNRARGFSEEEAAALARGLVLPVKIESGRVEVPGWFRLEKAEKWRDQEVRFVLSVPPGKYLRFEGRTPAYIGSLERKPDVRHPRVHSFMRAEHRLWLMDEEGLFCPTYVEENQDEERELRPEAFTRLRLEGPMKVYINRADYHAVRVEGRPTYTNRLEQTQTGDILHLTLDLEHTSEPVRVRLFAPHLHELTAENTDDIRIEGFRESSLSIFNEGRGDIRATLEVDTLLVDLSGRHELDLRGSGHFLRARLENNTRLDADRFDVRNAEVRLLDHTYAKVAVSDTLRQTLDPSSTLRAHPEPRVRISNLEQ